MHIRIQSLQIGVLIGFLVLMGMSSTLVPYLASPNNRVFAGFHGYSADYVQYVSYIKEGMYGRYTMYFRSFPPDQPATPINWMYNLAGFLFGPTGLEAPVVYHLLRVLLGAALVYEVYRLFLRLFASHRLAMLTTIVAFTSSCIGWIEPKAGSWSIHILNYFWFFVSTPQRVTDRPHYLLGSVLFLMILNFILRKHTPTTKHLIFLCIAAFATTMVHISSGIVLASVGAGLLAISLVPFKSFEHKRIHVRTALCLVAGVIIGATVSYYFIKIYSLISDVWIDKFIYSSPMTMTVFFQEALSFGPILWLGLPGLFLASWIDKTKPVIHRVLMATWGLSHMVLFFGLHRILHADQVRFIQSLYFIPLSYGTVWLLVAAGYRWGHRVFVGGLCVLFALTLPTYVTHLRRDLHDMTDYHTFAPFGFPTKNQYAAYTYLNLHSPPESTVLSDYDGANMLLMYSHNKVIGNDQGWSPQDGQEMLSQTAAWFNGSSSPETARKFLDRYHISYIYYGYKERNLGNITHYPFLKIVYENPEVTVYKVKTTQ